MNIVIMAGGGGTRLWPMSRTNKPKQFTSLISEMTMLEETYTRFKEKYSLKNIFISVTRQTFKLAKSIIKELPDDHFIIEPEKRDTGPAYAFVAAYLMAKGNPNEPMAYIASDHYIKDTNLLINSLKEAENIIKSTGKMMDIAITPTFPNINLGYTKIGKIYKNVNGIKIYNFAGHTEKPDLKTAKKFLKSNNYLWHASFFMWTPNLLLEAYKKYAPEIYIPISNIIKAFKNNDYKTVETEFAKTEKISIDYAVAEKMDHQDVLIIKGEFGWSDIGSWNMLYDQLIDNTDNSNNLIKANLVNKDTKNCLIYGPKDKLIATAGVENLVIVDTKDALLVCNKDESHLVKKIVEILKEDGRDGFI